MTSLAGGGASQGGSPAHKTRLDYVGVSGGVRSFARCDCGWVSSVFFTTQASLMAARQHERASA